MRCYRWDADKRKYLLWEDAVPEDAAIIRSVFERYSMYQKDRSFFFFRGEALSPFPAMAAASFRLPRMKP